MPIDVKQQLFRLIPKDKLSDFQIIGEGGFGYVYKARHSDWGTVAVKSLKAEHVADRYKKSLQDEAEKLSRLNHQNIVQLYGVVLETGSYSVVLEYVEHGNLDDFINTYSVPWNLKTRMVYSIVLGLNYLHTQTPPMIHRDLKSQNLLVTASFECKITDFGLSQWKSYSRQHTSHNKSQTQGGTVTHIPPEVWDDCNYTPDAKCDVYGMGILLWEIVTGRIPFEGLMDAQISLSVCKGQRPDTRFITEDTPARLVQLIELCWKQDPGTRPNCADMKRILDEEVSAERFQEECNQSALQLMKQITDKRSGNDVTTELSSIRLDSSSSSYSSGGNSTSDSDLPYPVQRQTPSLDSTKLQDSLPEAKVTQGMLKRDVGYVNVAVENQARGRQQRSPATPGGASGGEVPPPLPPKRGTDPKVHPSQIQPPRLLKDNKAQASRMPQHTPHQQAQAQPQHKKGPTARAPTSSQPHTVLPSHNLETDARPQQETPKEFDGKEYLKRNAEKPKHGHHPQQPFPHIPGMPPFGMPPPGHTATPSYIFHEGGSGGKTVVCMSNTVGNGTNIQIGDGNTMVVHNRCDGKSSSRIAPSKIPPGKITKSQNPVDEANMQVVARELGQPWMELGRALGFTSGELEALENDFRSHGHVETVYQMLIKWKQKMGKRKCQLATLAEKLVAIGKGDIAMKLKE